MSPQANSASTPGSFGAQHSPFFPQYGSPGGPMTPQGKSSIIYQDLETKSVRPTTDSAWWLGSGYTSKCISRTSTNASAATVWTDASECWRLQSADSRRLEPTSTSAKLRWWLLQLPTIGFRTPLRFHDSRHRNISGGSIMVFVMAWCCSCQFPICKIFFGICLHTMGSTALIS